MRGGGTRAFDPGGGPGVCQVTMERWGRDGEGRWGGGG